ncbi:MAG: prepilin-type N-terminal cleavage/methylation domain-containing protein [Myxococcota bacterium]
MRKPRGFTLLEMMIVVAIIGILGSLSVFALSSILQQGRVNGASARLTQLLRDARARSVTQRCPHFVQINARQYAPAAPPAGLPRRAMSASLIRKGNCNLPASQNFYEEGTSLADRDKVLLEVELADLSTPNAVTVYLPVPNTIVAGAELTKAIAVGFDANGRRTYAEDLDGDGTFTFKVDYDADDLVLDFRGSKGVDTEAHSRLGITAQTGLPIVE